MFNYTLKQKLVIKFSQKIMPLLCIFIPSNRLITRLWKFLGVKLGVGSVVTTDTRINVPFNLEVGNFSVINGFILSRDKVFIGNYVNLQLDSYIFTQSHDVHNAGNLSIYKAVKIDDYCWLGPRSMVLQGVHLKKGAVVAANSVVTKSNKEHYDILAGTPAIVKSKRVLFDNKYREDAIDTLHQNLYHHFQHKVE